MVGIFSFATKHTPPRPRDPRPSTDTDRSASPPPYRESTHAAQVYATETTTTTTTHAVTTTTQTTTHFFSLPLWRRRPHPFPPSDPNRHSMPDPLLSNIALAQHPPKPVVFLRDKDLPPTPSSTTEQDALSDPRNATSLILSTESVITPARPQKVVSPSRNLSQWSVHRPPKLPTSTTADGSSANPTATLARAALGLGLPPVILNNPSPASSSLDLNTVAFVTPPSPATSPESRPRAPPMRRAKSFQKVTENRHSEPSFAEVMERRRNRGLSLGPLHFGSDGSSKGKEKQKDSDPEGRPSMAKTLTRKASFWSRKRTDSTTNTPTSIVLPLPQERPAHPSLPSLQPVSPFYIDTKIPSSSLTPDYSSHPHPPELRRRHSERVPSSKDEPPPVLDLLDSSQQQPSQGRRRSRRPPTADDLEGLRAVSSYIPESVPFVTPSPSRHHIPNGTAPKSATHPSNSANMRPRAQTNPPLLHRLSVNLFGSPSSANSSVNVTGEGFTESPPTSVSNSARPSFSRLSVEIPKPRQEGESPELYLERLLEAVSKAEVATVLASRYFFLRSNHPLRLN